MVQGPDDDVLSYLIDVAMSETQDLLDSENSNPHTDHCPQAKLGGRKRGSSSLLHVLAGDKLS